MAMSTVTLDQVEALAMQLPVTERLRLAARICERAAAEGTGAQGPPAPRRGKSPEEVKNLLALLDAAAALWPPGKSDVAEEIRQMRAERDEQICPSE
jgi:hypothetical protein